MPGLLGAGSDDTARSPRARPGQLQGWGGTPGEVGRQHGTG